MYHAVVSESWSSRRFRRRRRRTSGWLDGAGARAPRARVAIVDGFDPREKQCGGGVQPRALAGAGLDSIESARASPRCDNSAARFPSIPAGSRPGAARRLATSSSASRADSTARCRHAACAGGGRIVGGGSLASAWTIHAGPRRLYSIWFHQAVVDTSKRICCAGESSAE